MKKILLFFVTLVFFLFFFSSKDSASALTCGQAPITGSSCVSSSGSVCAANGGLIISGATGCTSGSICCQFNACQTSADCSKLGKQCGTFTNNCNRTVSCANTCTSTQTCNTSTNKCVSYTCTNPNFCTASAGCIAANGLQTAPGYTCATGSVCCKSIPQTPPPPPPPGSSTACSSIDPAASCKAFSYCDAYGTTVAGATDCVSPSVCCKDNPNLGKCPVCPHGVAADSYYTWDDATQTCVNRDRGGVADPTWQTCSSGQICYSGQGCVNPGFSNGQLPCSGTSCPTALGPISIDPQGLVKSFFGVLLSIAGMLAVVLIILSGYRLVTSQGNPEVIQKAREQLTAAVVGLIFIILSFTILNFIGIKILNLTGQ